MAIVRINEFHAAAGKEAALRTFLTSIIGMIQGAPGCQRCELLADPDDPARLAIIENWDSVTVHKAAAMRIPKEKIAEIMPLLVERVKGRYYERVTATGGSEPV